MQVKKLKEVLQIATNRLQNSGYQARRIFGLQLDDHDDNEGDNEVFLFRCPMRVGPLQFTNEVGIIFDTTLNSDVLGAALASEIRRNIP